MNAQDRQRLEALYRALPGDEPLEPGDPRYFPIYDDPKLTSEDPVEQLARGIEWSERGNIQFLVGSHRCGKSTELRRLKARLEAAGHLVGLVDARLPGGPRDRPIPHRMALWVAQGAIIGAGAALAGSFRREQFRFLIRALAEAAAIENLRIDHLTAYQTKVGGDVISWFDEALRAASGVMDHFDRNSLIRSDGLNHFLDVFSKTMDLVARELRSDLALGKKLVVIVDSLEHSFYGDKLWTWHEWDRFNLKQIHQVYSVGPAVAEDPIAIEYVGDNARWIQPLQVYDVGMEWAQARTNAYLSQHSSPGFAVWRPEELANVMAFSGGCLGEIFSLTRQAYREARDIPVDSHVTGPLLARWRSKRLQYIKEADYSLLGELVTSEGPRSFDQLVNVAGAQEPRGRRERLGWFFSHGVILYRRDRGFFLHPALAPEVEKRLRAQRASSLQLPAPVPIDECLLVKRLEIHNLRIFDNFRLTLQTPTSTEKGHWLLFLGDNGVGKTTLLRSIVLALADRDAANALFQLLGPAAPFLSHGATEGSVEVRVDGRIYRAELERDARDVERIADSRDGAPLPVFAYGCQRGTALGGPRREVEFRPLDDVRTLFEPTAHLIHAETWLASLKLAALQDQGGAEETFFEAVRDTLVECLDGVDNLEVIKDGEVWLEGPSIGKARLAGLSDGYITTAGWILDWIARWADRSRRLGIALDGDFRERMFGLVLIDEIDLHLHPRWQVEIVRTVRRLFPRTSFVATTHNPLTLLGAEPDEIHVLRRGEDGRVEAIQRDIPAGTRADQVLTGEWFGLPSTLDRETLELLDRHRELLRQQVARENPERQKIEGELRLRLGTFADTSIERMVQSVAAELTPPIETLEKLGPEAREELREKILEEARKRRSSG